MVDIRTGPNQSVQDNILTVQEYADSYNFGRIVDPAYRNNIINLRRGVSGTPPRMGNTTGGFSLRRDAMD